MPWRVAQRAVNRACPALMRHWTMVTCCPNWRGFTLMTLNTDAPSPQEIEGIEIAQLDLSVTSETNKTLGERFLGTAERAVYLIRPDQHIVARWSNTTQHACKWQWRPHWEKHNEHPNPDPKYPQWRRFLRKTSERA